MPRKRAKNVDKQGCPLTSKPRLRLASAAQTAAIKASFPAGLAQPALRALVAAGYTQLEQLAKTSEQDLLSLHGMGPKAVTTIRAGLIAIGLDFSMDNVDNIETNFSR